MDSEVHPNREAEAPSLAETFDWLAGRYAWQTWMVSWGWYHRWMDRLATLVAGWAPRRVVDVGSGPGVLLARLERRLPDTELVAVDVSAPMLERVPPRVRRYPLSIEAFAPAHPAMFDAAILSFVLRDLTDRQHGLQAVSTTLRPGGRLAVLETHTPEGWRQGPFTWYFHEWLPRFGDRWLTRDWPYARAWSPYRRLAESHRDWGRGDQVPEWLDGAGFVEVMRLTAPTDVVALWTAVKA
jgi:ubiquinone/menaquinone biosynthesis C-methylase UbiE